MCRHSREGKYSKKLHFVPAKEAAPSDMRSGWCFAASSQHLVSTCYTYASCSQ